MDMSLILAILPFLFRIAGLSVARRQSQAVLLVIRVVGSYKSCFEAGNRKVVSPLFAVPKGPKIEKLQSRLKFSISLEIFNLNLATPPTWQRSQNPHWLRKSKKSLWGSLRGSWPTPQNESKMTLRSQKTGVHSFPRRFVLLGLQGLGCAGIFAGMFRTPALRILRGWFQPRKDIFIFG